MIRMSKLPLEGIRVVDSSYVFAGPYATGLLCDLGAEVIKIEGPARTDMTRGGAFSGLVPDNVKGADPWNRTSTFNLVNRGKKSLVLDLSKKEGREVFVDLLKGPAQVVGVADEEPARVLGERRQPALRVEPQEVLGLLERADQGLFGVVAERAERQLTDALLAGLLDLASRVGGAADDPQPGGVDRVDGDVRPVGGFDHGSQVRLQGRRSGQPLGEEDQRLAAGGGPLDEPEDLDLPVWAGVVPLRVVAGDPIPVDDL